MRGYCSSLPTFRTVVYSGCSSSACSMGVSTSVAESRRGVSASRSERRLVLPLPVSSVERCEEVVAGAVRRGWCSLFVVVIVIAVSTGIVYESATECSVVELARGYCSLVPVGSMRLV